MKGLNHYIWLAFLILGSSHAFTQSPKAEIEWPALEKGDSVICHSAYCLVYDSTHKLARWTAYTLSAKETYPLHRRSDTFITDPAVGIYSADIEDYKNSNYDPGHLVPHRDMAYDKMGMREANYMSNRAPQCREFNRGIWRALEAAVRKWAVTYDSVYVVTGPVLSDSLAKTGPNQLSIPDWFFKVVLMKNGEKASAISFLIPNKDGLEPFYSDYAISTDSLERFTGMDFFPQLPDSIEQNVEKYVVKKDWNLY